MSDTSQKLTVDQFAQSIKDKYPQYSSVDNATLTQKMLAKYPTYADKVDTTQTTGSTGTTGSPSSGGFLSNAWNVAKGVGKFVSNLGVGAGAFAADTVMGTVKSLASADESIVGAGASLSTGKKVDAGTGIASGIGNIKSQFDTALKPQTSTVAGSIGSTAAQIAAISAGTPAVSVGKEAIAGFGDLIKLTSEGKNLSELPYVGKVASYLTSKITGALPEAAFGFGYGKSQGQSNQQALQTAKGFGVFSGLGEVIGDEWKVIKGTVADNALRAFNIKGQMSDKQALDQVPKTIGALKTMSDYAGQITVKDASGVEKLWNPVKATILETADAFGQIKTKIYNQYTTLASKAGDQGANFSVKDFNDVIGHLNSLTKDATSGIKNKVATLIKDLEDNYATINSKSGQPHFKNTDLNQIQNFIQNINKDVNPLSDSAGAKVSDSLSRFMRDIMDNKITNATGEGYQELRTQYSNLKSIEKGVTDQVKKKLNGAGGELGNFIKGAATLESIISLASGNLAGGIKEAALGAFAKTIGTIKDPESSLQRAFSQLKPTEQSALKTRLTGVPK